MTKRQHVRDSDVLDDDATIVIRGGLLDALVLRADAQRYHNIYGEYGISVFAARDATVDELAQDVPLVRFEMLTLVRVGILRTAGFRLDPTGRNPWHPRSRSTTSRRVSTRSLPASTAGGRTRTHEG